MNKKHRNALAFYAEKYRVSLSTIKRYSAAGWQLDDPQEIIARMAAQKNQPLDAAIMEGVNVSQQRHLGIPANAFGVLLAGRLMTQRVNRWLRKIETSSAAMLNGESKSKIPLMVDLIRAQIRRELRNGIRDQFRCAAGVSWETVKRDRRSEEKAWHSEDSE